MQRDHIITSIRREVETTGKNEFPIEILPQKMQSIILTFHRYENYVTDFIVTALFSAASTAIGNTFRLRIKGLWTTNPALYVVLFGKPGLGKTPPIEAAYRPIRHKDEERLRKYLDERKHYELVTADGKTSMEKPQLVQTVLSDFTAEALMQAHHINLDGVAAVCDEIIGLIHSAERYNKSPLTEILLSAYSGAPLNVIRRSSETPIIIKEPCINIIGTTQTALLSQLSDKWMSNGFLDRVIFVHPQNSVIAPWVEEDETTIEQSVRAQKDWEQIVSRIHELKKDIEAQVLLHFTPEAKSYFFAWQNDIISQVNAVRDEVQVETREMKRCLVTAKLSLIIQILRHVCGEAERDAVDLTTVKAAITANEYFEESYDYFKQAISHTPATPVDNTKKTQFFEMCQGEFTTADALWIGEQLSVNVRTAKRWIKEAVANGTLKKLEHGRYKSVLHQYPTSS